MPQARQKAAVIPYRIRRARVEVALVTTSNGKGWIVPKGTVAAGERPRDAAIREAEEEAGLYGTVARKPLGHYLHVNGEGRAHVAVYLMRVTKARNHWDEDGRRTRRWMSLSVALERLRKELHPFVNSLHRTAVLES